MSWTRSGPGAIELLGVIAPIIVGGLGGSTNGPEGDGGDGSVVTGTAN